MELSLNLFQSLYCQLPPLFQCANCEVAFPTWKLSKTVKICFILKSMKNCPPVNALFEMFSYVAAPGIGLQLVPDT